MDWYRRSIHARRLVGMAAVSIGLSLAGWWIFNLLTPPQDNPFKPLDLALKPGLVTGFKLDSLKHDKPACFALLDEASVGYTRTTGRPIIPNAASWMDLRSTSR